MVNKSKNNIIGILGTVIIHLSVIIIFLVVKITASSSRIQEPIVIDFAEEEPEKTKEESREEEKQEDKEFWEWYKNQIRSNMAVNVENIQEDISTEKYIEQLQDELNEGREKIEIPELKDDAVFMESPEKKKEKGTEYSTRTNITYNLKNRQKKRIPNPVYLCEGSGDVKVRIHVNQKGSVVGTSIVESTGNECLHQAAMEAAERAYFNTDFNAPSRQEGWILFSFIAQ